MLILSEYLVFGNDIRCWVASVIVMQLPGEYYDFLLVYF